MSAVLHDFGSAHRSPQHRSTRGTRPTAGDSSRERRRSRNAEASRGARFVDCFLVPALFMDARWWIASMDARCGVRPEDAQRRWPRVESRGGHPAAMEIAKELGRSLHAGSQVGPDGLEDEGRLERVVGPGEPGKRLRGAGARPAPAVSRVIAGAPDVRWSKRSMQDVRTPLGGGPWHPPAWRSAAPSTHGKRPAHDDPGDASRAGAGRDARARQTAVHLLRLLSSSPPV